MTLIRPLHFVRIVNFLVQLAKSTTRGTGYPVPRVVDLANCTKKLTILTKCRGLIKVILVIIIKQVLQQPKNTFSFSSHALRNFKTTGS